MSLTTYTDLQNRVAEWLARDDLTAYIPDMVALFEAAACRRLRVRQVEATASITTTSGVGALPTDYLGHRRVTWMGTPRTELTYVTPPIRSYDSPYDSASVPQEFTIEASPPVGMVQPLSVCPQESHVPFQPRASRAFWTSR